MKIYTKTGDDGTTLLPKVGRVPKTDPHIQLLGSVDELNASIGLVNQKYILETKMHNIYDFIVETQKHLFDVGAEIATGKERINEKHIKEIEDSIDSMTKMLKPLKNFIIPFNHCEIHLARAVCRRVEIDLVKLMEVHQDFKNIVIYINRLSDFLFTLARLLGPEEKIWHG
jgi:cob(I)alamin adenosyltransferase